MGDSSEVRTSGNTSAYFVWYSLQQPHTVLATHFALASSQLLLILLPTTTIYFDQISTHLCPPRASLKCARGTPEVGLKYAWGLESGVCLYSFSPVTLRVTHALDLIITHNGPPLRLHDLQKENPR